MPFSHLILCRPLLLLPPIPPSIRVFSYESTLHMRWPKYWSFSFSISPSNEHPGLISFRMDWLDFKVGKTKIANSADSSSMMTVKKSWDLWIRKSLMTLTTVVLVELWVWILIVWSSKVYGNWGKKTSISSVQFCSVAHNGLQKRKKLLWKGERYTDSWGKRIWGGILLDGRNLIILVSRKRECSKVCEGK